VTLPTARSGLMTAVILATARGIGETSPVLLTAGYTAVTNWNPLSGPQVNMPLASFLLIRTGQPNQVARGFGIAAALMMLVVVLFVLARLIGGRPAGQLSKRALRRRAAQSRRDATRREQRTALASLASSTVPVTDGDIAVSPEEA
jgi:phosphate transport system permease protein